MKPRSLRENALWTIGGSLTYALGQWGVAITLARTGGPGAVGVFALGTAVAMPVLALSQFALRQVYIVCEDDDRRFDTYLVLRIISTAVAFIALLCITGAVGYSNGTWFALGAIALGRCFESISDIYYAEMQRQRRQDRIARFMSYRAALCLALVILCMILFKSVSAASVAFAVACGTTMILIDGGSLLRLAKGRVYSSLSIDWADVYQLAKRGAPLAGAHLFNTINANVPRYVIARVGSLVLLGQYAILEYFVAAGSLVINAVGQATSPELAQESRQINMKRFRQLAWKLIGLNASIGALGTVLAAVLGTWLVTLLYGSSFAPVAHYLPSLALAFSLVFIVCATGYIITARGIFISQMPIVMVASAINFFVAALTLKQWSLNGVALGIGLGAVFQFVCFLVILRRSFKRGSSVEIE